ncbi:MAG: hypothetical protein NVSMB66_5290 [Candidatus Doudnabacteria bacterium]
MFTRKMVLIIAGVFALIAIVSVIFLSSKKNTPVVTDNGQDAGTTTQNGGVSKVNPSPTTDGRNFTVKQDPAQPFTSVNPRGVEPNVVVAKPGKFQDYSKAVADGSIPDQDGLYHQVVDPNFNPRASASLNVSDTSFLQDNFPTAPAVIAGNTQGQLALNNTDPLATIDHSNDSTVIPTIPNFNGPTFRLGQDSSANFNSYLSSLSDTTKTFDIIYGNQIGQVLANDNVSQLNAAKAKVLGIMDAMSKLTVPPKFLGLAQSYYQGYQISKDLIDDQIGTTGSNRYTVVNAASKLTLDVKRFSDSIGFINSDINIAARLSQ